MMTGLQTREFRDKETTKIIRRTNDKESATITAEELIDHPITSLTKTTATDGAKTQGTMSRTTSTWLMRVREPGVPTLQGNKISETTEPERQARMIGKMTCTTASSRTQYPGLTLIRTSRTAWAFPRIKETQLKKSKDRGRSSRLQRVRKTSSSSLSYLRT